ncbi:MAG: F0F1 ATP synthase subunit B [Pirellulaceae bacterium]|nr:F0F1 ATP synthase subunit B [Pirellulaceae bacterium]
MFRFRSFEFWMLLLVALLSMTVRPAIAQSDTSSKKTSASAGVAEVKEIAEEEAAHDAHDAHEHHDPTHAFAGSMQANPMEWRADGAIFSLIVFLLLLAVLGVFAWKPISEGLTKREAGIARAIEDAKKASEAAAVAMKDYQAKLEAAQAQAQEMVSQARKDAETAGQRIVADAQAEAGRQRDRALADIEAAKQTALSELAGRSTEMAFSLARKVVGRELNTGDHQNLIQEALRQMPNRN